MLLHVRSFKCPPINSYTIEFVKLLKTKITYVFSQKAFDLVWHKVLLNKPGWCLSIQTRLRSVHK